MGEDYYYDDQDEEDDITTPMYERPSAPTQKTNPAKAPAAQPSFGPKQPAKAPAAPAPAPAKAAPPPKAGAKPPVKAPARHQYDDEYEEESDDAPPYPGSRGQPQSSAKPSVPPPAKGSSRLLGAGDNVTGVAQLFNIMSAFKPEVVDLTVHWKPFIPPLVTSIGSIDAFIKVPRPDGDLDDLGLVWVDEPSIAQSNPQVLKMELRERYAVGTETTSDAYVGFIEDPGQNRKALDSWLESMEEIHRRRPPPAMTYSTAMPELEDLMEPWEPAVQDVLSNTPFPRGLDLSFEEEARVVCALLGIPVRGNNIIESLHVLFSLYSRFQENAHFQHA